LQAPSSTPVLKKFTGLTNTMEFDLENPLTDSHEPHSDTIPSLFLVESDHMPSENYSQSLQAQGFDISVRREAISSISKVFTLFISPKEISKKKRKTLCFNCSWCLLFFFLFQLSCDFDPLLSYLAVNYLDRFLSSQGMLVKKPTTR
jgi:cyclin D6